MLLAGLTALAMMLAAMALGGLDTELGSAVLYGVVCYRRHRRARGCHV